MKLSYKMLIPIVLVTFVMLSLFGVLAYTYLSREVNDIYTWQIDSILLSLEGMIEQNEEVTDFVMDRNDQKNLALARALAEIIRLSPEETLTGGEMVRMAELLGVDEVHVMDEKGILVLGNEPVYFDLDFRSSDQTKPFLELLEDSSLEIAQELRENSQGLWFQYYGVARTDDSGFVQVGIDHNMSINLENILDVGNTMEMITVGQGGFTALIEDGTITAHRYPERVGEYVGDSQWFQTLTLSGAPYSWVKMDDGERYLAGFLESNGMIITAFVPRSEVYAVLGSLRIVYLVLVLIIAAALVASLFLCIRLFIIRPITQISGSMDQLSNGDLNAFIASNYGGEFGDLKQAINHTIGELKTFITDISSILGSMAKDNYNIEVTGEYQGDFSPIKEGLNKIVERINIVMGDITTSAYNIAFSAHDITMASQDLAQGALDQSNSIDSLTSAVKDMSLRTANTAEISRQTSVLADFAAENARQGNLQVQQMQRTMGEINTHTSQISHIVTTIDDIAMQTDLLALNAAVEAARAGQYGRGFSVVAEQVRQLANSSQAAARETAGMLKSIAEKVNEGMNIADGSAQSLHIIVEGISNIARQVERVTEDAVEQDASIQQVDGMLELIREVTKKNAETSRETAITAEELHQQVDMFQQMISRFRLKAV